MRRSRMGRPSLIGTAARTAVIAGTATVVSGAVAGSMQKSAQQKAAAQQAAAADAQQQAQGEPPVQADVAPVQADVTPEQAGVTPVPDMPAAQSTDDQLAQLQKLGELHQSGILSDEEFAAMKAKILQ